MLADTRWPEGALAALFEAARDAGLPAVLDADRPIPADGALLRAATHVAFSADALADYTGVADPARGLERAASGPAGLVRRDRRARTACSRRRAASCATTPASMVPVVDTLGAGDVWHGAFALALAEGRDEAAAVRFASAAAALKVQRTGGRSGAPTRAELDSFLAARRVA